MDVIKPLIQVFEKHLSEHPLTREPFNLYQPADYILSLGGKRLRPVFVLMGYDFYKKDIERSLNAAMAVEIFHNFTLLHDDIMDKAEIRRGKPTVHIKYNTNTAILTGDVMMIQAYQYLLDYKDAKTTVDLLNVFNKMAFEVCEGQQMDMDFETQDDVTIDQYLQMITLKTSVLMAASVQMGAILAGADDKDQKHLYEFAKNFGIAFQLQDDVLDTFGDAASVGKRIGGDIIQNKKTYLYLKAIELADDKQRSELKKWYDINDTFEENEKIDSVKKIFESVVVKEYTAQVIEAYRDLAISHLNACKIEKYRCSEITDLIDSLINRKH